MSVGKTVLTDDALQGCAASGYEALARLNGAC
jgi:hypothetical protein